MKSITFLGSACLTFALLSSPTQAITLITDRSALGGNDEVFWSSIITGNAIPFTPVANNFTATSQGGRSLRVDIPVSSVVGMTPPLVFQTLATPPAIPTNFASGDFILFTGLVPTRPSPGNPVPPPAIGNPGPLTITFNIPVKGAGAQIAVDDASKPYEVFIDAFDVNNSLLAAFSTQGTSSIDLDNSAVFLGVLNDIPNISKIVYSSNVFERAIGINNLSLISTPEPNFLLGLALIGLGLLLKKSS